jgi:hypothetical protein
MGEEGVNELKEEAKKIYTWNAFKDVMLNGKMPNLEEIKMKVEEKVNAMKFIPVDLPDKLWDTLKVTTQLVITGESINIEKRLETLTNLYNVLSQTNPQAAEKVLGKILSITGENYDTLTGVKPADMQNPQLQGTGMPQGGGQIPQGQMAGPPKQDALMSQITNAPQV